MEEKSSNSAMEEKKVVHNFSASSAMSLKSRGAMIFYAVVVLLGIGTGYVIASRNPSYNISSQSPNGASGRPVKGQTYGSTDSSFKDTAEGELQNGGIDGEGAFHLVRPGGDSQNVYMTSSTIDLSKFVGSKVKVWGQTQTAQKAGWLMDVGRLQVE